MKKQNNSKVVFGAALAGAIAAGAVIATYEVLKSEKGQAGIAKAKAGVANTVAKAKITAVAAADKAKVVVANAADMAKTVVANTADLIKSKLPCKADEACDCDDLGLEDENVAEVETAEAEA